MAPTKMNSTQGIPGDTNFRYKLPKYVTKASLSLATFHLRQSYLSLKQDINIDESEFILQTLSHILPSLNHDICKHFALTLDFTNEHVPNFGDDPDANGRHIETPGTCENAQEGECTNNDLEQKDDKDDPKTCIWCNKTTNSNNEKALCPECVAIPERIRTLEIRFREAFECSSNNEGTRDPETNPCVPMNTPAAQVTEKADETMTGSRLNNTKSHECPNDSFSLEQTVLELTRNVQQLNEKLETVQIGKTNNHVTDTSSVKPAPDHSCNNEHAGSGRLSEKPENTSSIKSTCPSAEQQLRDYRNSHRSKQSAKYADMPPAYPISDPQNVDVLIIGDSLIKPIIPSKMSRRLCIKSKSLPGARIEDAFDTVCHLAREIQPREIIIHLGTNNIPYDEKDEMIAKLISLADQIAKMTPSKSATLSSIIHRAYETDEESAKVDDINGALKLLANQRRWSFIDNDNIIPGLHLAADGVHLNNNGTRVLARNLITRLRDQSSVSRGLPLPDPLPNQRPRSPDTVEFAQFSHRQDFNQNSYAMAAESENSAFRSRHHRKFRKKPKGRVFPRDWLDSLQTARMLLNSDQ